MITLSLAASNKIKQQLQKRGRGLGIQLGVKTTGCSGLAYVLEYVDTLPIDNECFECLGCKIYIDPKSYAYLKGVEIDYVRNGLNEGFTFNNPNERDRCGCGVSFRV
jgi:iron-sulfur cluster assembly protein